MQSRNETDILTEMIQDAVNRGTLRASPELIEQIRQGININNQYILDFATHSTILAELETENNENYTNINIATATGEALDNFGKLLNVPRITASPAYVELEISLSVAGSSDIVLGAGTPVFIQEVVPVGDYILSEDVVINAGVTKVTARAESVDYGYQNNVPSGTVTGIHGADTLSVTNLEDGSHGRNIEEDEDYRERIGNWSRINTRGTRECITNYLDNYTGLDDYKLIPRYNGVGTLKIVCDTSSNNLEDISNSVHSECLDVLDALPVCVLPEDTHINNISFDIQTTPDNILSENELRELIVAQVRTFVEGGLRRGGNTYKGLGIGGAYQPAQLLKYLMGEIPEILNIVPDSMETVEIPETNRLQIDNVSVNFL